MCLAWFWLTWYFLNKKDLEDMKKRLKEIEEEAGALREMQAKVEKEMGAVQGLFLSHSLCIYVYVGLH